MIWNHDTSAAPRGRTIQVQRLVKDKNSTSGETLRTFEEQRREYILAVHRDGMVAQSYWIPPRHTQGGTLLEGNRWSGFNVGSDPIAWAPWPTYEFQAKASGDNGATVQAEKVPADSMTGDASRPSRGGDTPALITHKHIFLDDVGSGA